MCVRPPTRACLGARARAAHVLLHVHVRVPRAHVYVACAHTWEELCRHLHTGGGKVAVGRAGELVRSVALGRGLALWEVAAV